MPHDCVRPGRNNTLVFRNFDRRRRERVLSIHEENEIKPYRNKKVPCNHAAKGHVRPTITMVEGGLRNEHRYVGGTNPTVIRSREEAVEVGRRPEVAGVEPDRV